MFQFEKQSQTKCDLPNLWEKHRLTMNTIDNDYVGHISAAFIPRKNLVRYLPSVHHYKAFSSGNYKNIKPCKDLPEKVYKQYKAFQEYHVDKPRVSYIWIEPEYRGDYLSISLYIKMSEWMKSLGYKGIFADLLQRKPAKKVWQKMENHNIVTHIDDYNKFI